MRCGLYSGIIYFSERSFLFVMMFRCAMIYAMETSGHRITRVGISGLFCPLMLLVCATEPVELDTQED